MKVRKCEVFFLMVPAGKYFYESIIHFIKCQERNNIKALKGVLLEYDNKHIFIKFMNSATDSYGRNYCVA